MEWNISDINTLKKMYSTHSNVEIAKILNTTTDSVQKKLKRLKLIRTKEETKIILNRIMKPISIKRWNNKKYRNKMLKHLSMIKTKETQQNAGRNSRIFENKVAKRLEKEYDHVFMPQSVCDRICIKDDKIFFIEIKQKRDKLRPLQEEFSKLTGLQYKIVRN